MTEQEKLFIEIFYPEYGSDWVASQLSLEPKQVSYYASDNKIKRHTLKSTFDIADALNISESRVRQILKESLSKLHTLLEPYKNI